MVQGTLYREVLSALGWDISELSRAIAALDGYIRDAGLVAVPETILVHQGQTIGCPSRIVIDIPVAGGIVVTGTAVPTPHRPA
jgi:hypothetical protein